MQAFPKITQDKIAFSMYHSPTFLSSHGMVIFEKMSPLSSFLNHFKKQDWEMDVLPLQLLGQILSFWF